MTFLELEAMKISSCNSLIPYKNYNFGCQSSYRNYYFYNHNIIKYNHMMIVNINIKHIEKIKKYPKCPIYPMYNDGLILKSNMEFVKDKKDYHPSQNQRLKIKFKFIF